jgi:hypothetical protein
VLKEFQTLSDVPHCNGVVMVLWWCSSGAAVVLQWCSNGVAVVLQ